MHLQKIIYAAALAATLFAGQSNVREPAFRNATNTQSRQQNDGAATRNSTGGDSLAA